MVYISRMAKILAVQSGQIKIPAGALTLQHGNRQSHLFQHCCYYGGCVSFFESNLKQCSAGCVQLARVVCTEFRPEGSQGQSSIDSRCTASLLQLGSPP